MQKIGVLTSGGDAPGMNAAVRTVVRFALDNGLLPVAIYEGYRGLIEGGERIKPIDWTDVGGILQHGGTIIGSARCSEFRERSGRLKAAYNLIEHGIGGLVVLGGDGTLTGAAKLYEEWPSLVTELAQQGLLDHMPFPAAEQLAVVGLPASIDNDLCYTDITIGADTALHRITNAIDAITSTAASHQRSFVIEVMGRKCGYLAMMGGLASAADWVLIPESPPNLDDWEAKMCDVLRIGREIGRRDSIVVVAEGAHDRYGNPIKSDYVKRVLEDRLQEDTRLTILGHVQRGGAPTAFDRNLSTLLGAEAIRTLLDQQAPQESHFIGLIGNKITRSSLVDCLKQTAEVASAIEARDFDRAMSLRGNGFQTAFQTLRTLVRAQPHDPDPERPALRIAVLNAGGPAPGMNTAVRAAVRLGVDHGHTMLGVHNGFQGLIDGDIHTYDWMRVNGWAPIGGSFLGTSRKIPAGSEFYKIARNFELHNVEAVLMIGGTAGYHAALALHEQRHIFPGFNIPIVCLPSTIDNDLPGAELSVGADTALNSIVEAIDKIKQSAGATRRVFVIEVMGRYCGYLALTSALASGAERVYLHEEGVTLSDMIADVDELISGFKLGKRLGVIVRNEQANETYSTQFVCALFEEEGRDQFDVRQAILGHLQQGGNPTPFDRILATRLAARCIDFFEQQIGAETPRSAAIGLSRSSIRFTDLDDTGSLIDLTYDRPKQQWWLDLRPIARVLAQTAPRSRR